MDFRHLLAGYLMAVPLLWALGLDQFLLYLALPLVILRALAGPLTIPADGRALRWALILLLGAMSLSVVSLAGESSLRWITYARDYLAIASVIAVLLLQRPLAPGEGTTVVVLAAVWFMFVANLAGLTAWATGFSDGFLSPAGHLVPGLVLDSELARNTFVKRLLLDQSTSLFGIEFTRVRSFFIYPNTYALAIGVTLPMTFYLLVRNALLSRWAVCAVYAVILCVSAFGMFLSFSRSGLGALAGGFLVFSFLSLRQRLGFYARTLLKAFAVVAVLGMAYLVYTQWTDVVYEIAVARGASNLEYRSLVFYESFRQLLDNPIGFGTQRDAPGILLPLGSHSQFVAVAYKYGFAGLAAWLLFLLVLGRRILRGLSLASRQGNIEAVAFYGAMGWALFTNLAHQVTAELMLDTLTFSVMLAFWLAVLARPLPGYVAATDPAPGLRPALA